MKERIKRRFHGLEKEFDKWWDMKGGGDDIYNELIRTYPFWKDPFGKRKKNELVQIFNMYIKITGLE